MELKVWLLYLLTVFLLAVTPGPAVMLVSAQGLKYGTKPSIYGALGISSGNLMYFILSSLGLGALILAAGNLFEYIKIAGAIYLIFIGTIMIYNTFNNNSKRNSSNDIETFQNYYKSYIQGFVIQASNPKAIIFFVSLLAQFIITKQNVSIQFFIVGLTTIILETPILIIYGWITSNGKKIIGQNKRLTKWKDRLSGSVLISLGINLFFIKSKA